MIKVLSFMAVLTALCAESMNAQSGTPPAKGKVNEPVTQRALVTFVELGSVNCIPCRQMQPVMKAIEQKFGDQVKIVFHDVWKEDQKHYARQYGIRLIPTQVFLDENGKEIMRHEGFFPEKEISAFLEKRGLKPRQQGKGF